MSTMISRTRQLAMLALVASTLGAVLPAHALSIVEPAEPPTGITRVSVTIPASRTSRLERRDASAYMIRTSIRRVSALPSANPTLEPAQLLWLAALLTSMCGFALYFGRELTTRFSARRG